MQLLRPPVAKSFLPKPTDHDLLSPDFAEQALMMLELNSDEDDHLFFRSRFNHAQLDDTQLLPPMLQNLIFQVVDRQFNHFSQVIERMF